MRIISSRLRSPAVVLVTALMLAGCDGARLAKPGAPTAGKELSAMRSVIAAATTVHLSESLSGNLVDVNVSGSGAFGRLVEGGMSATISVRGDKTYLNRSGVSGDSIS